MQFETNFMNNGWGGFEQGQRELPDDQKKKLEREAQDRLEKQRAIAKKFKGPQGKLALSYLRELTIEQPCFNPNLPDGVAVNFGFFREGQNSIVRDIERLVDQLEKGEL